MIDADRYLHSSVISSLYPEVQAAQFVALAHVPISLQKEIRMSRPGKAARIPALIGGVGVLSQIVLFCSLGASAASAADAYFSPAGADVAGFTIGVDCTLAAPCKTVSKALSFLASNIASGAGPKRNYTLAFDGGSGPFRLSSAAILTSGHTVSSGYTTTFDVYNGAQAAWSGGLDTAGTWKSTTLPSGAPGCVSSYLARTIARKLNSPLPITRPT
jgi:hypothetical protein